MTKKQYAEGFKEQLIEECQEVQNVALVARRHGISPNTIHTWIRKFKKNGSVNPLPKNEAKRIFEIEERLKNVSKENNTLKKLLGEKELDILRPQREIRNKHPKRLAKQAEINRPNQLWQIDLKYGYIMGIDSFFFQLSLIDVCDRSVIDYHLGLSCKAKDAARVLKNSLAKRCLGKGMNLPIIRADNGPQFTSNLSQETIKEIGITHERIPVKTPNMIAHIESFHSILESECYCQNEFKSFMNDIVKIEPFSA